MTGGLGRNRTTDTRIFNPADVSGHSPAKYKKRKHFFLIRLARFHFSEPPAERLRVGWAHGHSVFPM